jgi:hypothetical protein
LIGPINFFIVHDKLADLDDIQTQALQEEFGKKWSGSMVDKLYHLGNLCYRLVCHTALNARI